MSDRGSMASDDGLPTPWDGRDNPLGCFISESAGPVGGGTLSREPSASARSPTLPEEPTPSQSYYQHDNIGGNRLMVSRSTFDSEEDGGDSLLQRRATIAPGVNDEDDDRELLEYLDEIWRMGRDLNGPLSLSSRPVPDWPSTPSRKDSRPPESHPNPRPHIQHHLPCPSADSGPLIDHQPMRIHTIQEDIPSFDEPSHPRRGERHGWEDRRHHLLEEPRFVQHQHQHQQQQGFSDRRGFSVGGYDMDVPVADGGVGVGGGHGGCVCWEEDGVGSGPGPGLHERFDDMLMMDSGPFPLQNTQPDSYAPTSQYAHTNGHHHHHHHRDEHQHQQQSIRPPQPSVHMNALYPGGPLIIHPAAPPPLLPTPPRLPITMRPHTGPPVYESRRSFNSYKGAFFGPRDMPPPDPFYTGPPPGRFLDEGYRLHTMDPYLQVLSYPCILPRPPPPPISPPPRRGPGMGMGMGVGGPGMPWGGGPMDPEMGICGSIPPPPIILRRQQRNDVPNVGVGVGYGCVSRRAYGSPVRWRPPDMSVADGDMDDGGLRRKRRRKKVTSLKKIIIRERSRKETGSLHPSSSSTHPHRPPNDDDNASSASLSPSASPTSVLLTPSLRDTASAGEEEDEHRTGNKGYHCALSSSLPPSRRPKATFSYWRPVRRPPGPPVPVAVPSTHPIHSIISQHPHHPAGKSCPSPPPVRVRGGREPSHWPRDDLRLHMWENDGAWMSAANEMCYVSEPEPDTTVRRGSGGRFFSHRICYHRRTFMDHAMSADLDDAVAHFLGDVRKLECRSRLTDLPPSRPSTPTSEGASSSASASAAAVSARDRRVALTGLREVSRALAMGRLKVILVAPNIEEITSLGGLEDRVKCLMMGAAKKEVPVIFALSRAQLGRALGKNMRVSLVGVQSIHRCADTYKQMIETWLQHK
ncbi:unnamed protein product [Vitrella brassicaformis CCMP3155]|uniref:Ribosomal protein eL8/eL30/eS12/Gadd45 domain-containing protein n=2 Tax=Vitrella brassicaformis TaxID=1169539 RepID=A0A0G4EEF0_VITBC|nr:unnamed protein product [Vitrella brassicaformis CCMP3155]|eukprot:CEL93937.1 unnamed protein product [Vitrella brassicaformis CCMP3155]